MNVYTIILAYLGVINLIGFMIMGIDKQKARKHAFRVPEATLFTIAIIGGSIGTILGMFTFRHKTRHWYFLYGLPAILVLQIALSLFILFGPLNIKII